MSTTTKHTLLTGTIAAGVALVAIHAHSTELGIDWGRKEGVDVPSGQSATQTDAIRVSDGGAFVKAGDGTLALPLDKLDSVADISVEVRAGRLEIEPGVPQGGAVSAPSVIADKAAFWVDADTTSSLVLNGSVVTRWCDRREADTASPTRYNARPATASNAGTVEIDQTLVETNGHNAVYFGGHNNQNKRFMQFYKGEAESEIVYIRHAFVVFGAIDCYSGPIGCKQNPDDWFSAAGIAKMADAPKYFGIRYGEASPGAFTARHYLDGVRFDPWSTEVKRGFQLWETQFPEYTGTAGNFFNHKIAWSAFPASLRPPRRYGMIYGMSDRNLQIPCGVFDFKTIRTEGLYYVDKTGFIPLLEQAGRFLFFVRPRRFGKSLMANMLRCYYDIAEERM